MVREAFFILIIAVKVASNFNVLLLAMTRRNFVGGGG